MARARQVRHVAGGVIELVGGGHGIAVMGVRVGIVGDGVLHGDLLMVDHVVRIGLDGDVVIALLQHVRLSVLLVVGGHVVIVELDLHGLGSARLELLGLFERNQVLGCLLDAAIGVRRVVVDLDHVLAGLIAGVGDGHIERDLAVLVGDLAHLLLERRVGQAVAEREHDGVVVVDQTFVGGGLIELVANVDAFDVVDERRGHRDLVATEAHVGSSEIIRIVVSELAVRADGRSVAGGSAIGVVEHSGLGQVLHERVGGLAGRIHIAGEHLTQCGEAGLAGRRAPQHGLDLRILGQEVELERVGAVVDERHLLEVLGDQVDHVALGLGQLQEVLAILEIFVVLGIVVVGDALRLHVRRQVSAFAADAGDGDDGFVGEVLGVGDQLVGILLGRNLRQGPILRPHSHHRAVLAVVGVQLGQLGIGFDAGLLHAVKHGNGLVLVGHGAGAGAAVNRVGGAPTEHVDLLVGQRQVGIVVLQHGDGFRLHFLGQLVGFGNGGVGQHVLGGGRVVEQRGKRAGQHHGHGHDDADKRHQPGFGMDDLTGRHFLDRLLVDGKSDNQREREQHANRNKVRRQ